MHSLKNLNLRRRTNAGLQVQRLTLTAENKPSFTLFPMIHLADTAFFHQVMDQADSHDCVLKEGVNHRGLARSARRAYTSASRNNPGLTVQPSGPTDGGHQWYNSDLPPEDFDRHWSKVPLWRRVVFRLALRVIGFALRFGKARAWLTESLGDTSLDTSDALDSIFGKEIRQVVLDRRDSALLQSCIAVMDGRAGESIAIVWGAAHLPQLAQALTQEHGYSITCRKWITALAPTGPID